MSTPRRPRIYITGHQKPDCDSIASAIGYAELKQRLDPETDYVPVRLGEVNSQTRWVLKRAGADPPDYMEHIALRVRDVMRESFPTARDGEPIREVGLEMSRHEHDLMPILDADGALVGVMTERALARRFVRESREASSLADAPTAVGVVAEVLEGELVCGDPEREISGRVWTHSIEAGAKSRISEGDVVVIGARPDAQRATIELGAALMVASSGSRPDEDILELAREHGTAVIVSQLDTYVSARLITLAAPCRALMDRDPLTVGPDDLVADISDQVKDIHYRAAIAIDADGKPIGLITRSDLVAPRPRKVILVDHAEQAQSVRGIETAEIVEILDHHHIGSIETRVPVKATFDPVGSTATLIVERFRQNGMEPAKATAMVLLGAVLSDTVILNSPTTTDRDRAVVEYLEPVLSIDATEFGREMFEASADVAGVSADEIVGRDAKEYDVGGDQRICIAQIETVGKGLLDRREELLEAMHEARDRNGYLLYALMITDILSHGTDLLIAGDAGPAERAFDAKASAGVIELPGVMSRKKQVAPKLMAAA